MKRIKELIILGVLISCLSACTANVQKEKVEQDQDFREANSLEDQGDEWDNYVEDFSAYDFTREMNATVNDRHFEAEEAPENVVEELVFDHYYYDIKGEFDQFADIYGEIEALKISARNTKKKFEEGAYIKEYIIHSLSTWSKEEFQNSDYVEIHILKDDVLKYQLSSFAIVQVDISMALSQAALERGPQLGDGEYTRGFLCGKKTDDDIWKIYNIYWIDE
ncbi:MAG: hypothetical protein EOM28_01825 [Clostridia bacterium]|nr:hypothetical protein [Clostridia bacterium]